MVNSVSIWDAQARILMGVGEAPDYEAIALAEKRARRRHIRRTVGAALVVAYFLLVLAMIP